VKALLQAAGLVDDALAKEGLERIDDAGAPFDPTVHDAVEHAAAAAGDTPGTAAGPVVAGPVVAEVLRPGYRWKGRVIRPAMVRVRG
jgi:molecular chaperone GrpE